MTTIRWEAPSKVQVRRKKPRFYKQMKALKNNPGVWGNVVNFQSRFTATNAATTFRNNGFQAAVRKTTGNWYKVYARYVP